MYIPTPFEEKRLPVLHELIDVQPFGALVTMGVGGLFATHIPMVLERGAGAFGTLKGHVSRANTQWRDFSPDVEALTIFAGDHHYIRPGWLPEKQETGRVVPTWNYAVVHAYGRLTVKHDAGWLMAHLESLTGAHESGFPAAWKVSDAPPEFIAGHLKGIVGLELSITRIEGKWKASQNRSEKGRAGIAMGLESLGTPESLAMKAMVEGAKS
jgi:transcriptional regulator